MCVGLALHAMAGRCGAQYSLDLHCAMHGPNSSADRKSQMRVTNTLGHIQKPSHAALRPVWVCPAGP